MIHNYAMLVSSEPQTLGRNLPKKKKKKKKSISKKVLTLYTSGGHELNQNSLNHAP